jgi:membrane protease YdiL (CAAX protease family)
MWKTTDSHLHSSAVAQHPPEHAPTPAANAQTAATEPPTGAALRYAIVGVVVAVYIGLGFVLRPDANTYLLIGIPFTLVFQVLVARRPVRELWLNHGQAFRVDGWTLLLLVVCLVGPIQTLVSGVRAGSWPIVVYAAAALVGAVGAALALRVLSAASARQLLTFVLVAVPLGLLRLLLQQWSSGGLQDLELGSRLLVELESVLFYVSAVFVVEEVFFRGALDSYLHRQEAGFGWGSAAYVSVLWGLWHTPLVGELSIAIVAELIGAQLFLGLILSWLWRRTGNLAAPGVVHAVVDSVRNALLM